MNWVFIGLLLGSTVTSHHETREACEGRAVVLKEKGVAGKCHDQSTGSFSSNGSIRFNVYPNSSNTYRCTNSDGTVRSCN